jgi:acetylcholinesterase
LGTYHASDIPIAFGTHHLLDGAVNNTNFEAEVSRSFLDHILAFARDPYHGPQNTMGWQPMNTSDPKGGDLIRFGADGKVVQHVDGIEVDGIRWGVRDNDLVLMTDVD